VLGVFTGSMILMEGEVYLQGRKGQGLLQIHHVLGNVDHDGDRYGFVRNMKSAQDEYNSRRSKRCIHRQLPPADPVAGRGCRRRDARREWARPDGVVVVQGNNVNEGAKADDQSFDFAGQLKLMENAIRSWRTTGRTRR
jgi:hypothetical protein